MNTGVQKTLLSSTIHNGVPMKRHYRNQQWTTEECVGHVPVLDVRMKQKKSIIKGPGIRVRASARQSMDWLWGGIPDQCHSCCSCHTIPIIGHGMAEEVGAGDTSFGSFGHTAVSGSFFLGGV